jgi:hypothetical protein
VLHISGVTRSQDEALDLLTNKWSISLAIHIHAKGKWLLVINTEWAHGVSLTLNLPNDAALGVCFPLSQSTIMRIGYLHQKNSIFFDFAIVAKSHHACNSTMGVESGCQQTKLSLWLRTSLVNLGLMWTGHKSHNPR